MKSLWSIIAVMALINILAIGALLGWLHSSGRLSRERFQAVKSVFTTTVADEQQQKAADAAAAEQSRADAASKAKLAEPPKTAADQIADQQFRDEQREQLIQRQRQELESLRSALLVQVARLQERESKLAAERTAFAEERRKLAETDGSKQFKEALATLEGQKPRDAKVVLDALLQARLVDQVVAYLARMEEGKRTKVIAEFVKDDPNVAADLLERLRTRGGVAAPITSSPAVPPSTQTAANDAQTPRPSLRPGAAE